MIQIVPAIDIIGAKCVRLTKGDYASTKVYSGQPLDMAMQFEDCGCRRLHLVDLDGAISHHVVNYKILEQIASKTNLIIDFGGGLKSEEDAHIAFESGASMITGGSIAIKNPVLFERLVLKYGPGKVILGADANHGKIAVNGWTEDSDTEIVPFIQHMIEHNKIQKVISTDIECDGMLKGPSISLYKDILKECKDLYLIASGGVCNMSDVEALAEINIPEVIIGKAIYEGNISLKEMSQFNLQ